MTAAHLTARRAGPLKGTVRTPGDKSISHRALILGALASGVTEIEGLLEGDDVKRTAAAMAAFGAGVERLGEGKWRVEGQGGFSESADVVDCGNAGTGVRLIMGAAAGFDMAVTFTGDASLRGRPMNRVLKPLGEMGADLSVTNVRDEGGETVADITARHSELEGVEVPPERAPSMIDEYPILGVAAAFARGKTVMRGIGEMRVKESDRIALMAAGLSACGIGVEEEAESLTVIGAKGSNHLVAGGAGVTTHGDHRIAMSHLILGLAADEPVSVDEPGMIATSFPGFVDLMRGLGAEIEGEAA